MKALMIALSMTSSGCATTPPQPDDPDQTAGCDASAAQHLIGREATRDVGEEAMRRTGARTMRWLPEGSIVTMEYRADRLNIHLDRGNKVKGIACG